MATMMQPGMLISCAVQLYVTIGAPDGRSYTYDTSGCDMAMQVDTSYDGDAGPGFWPLRFDLTRSSDRVLWWP